MVMRSQNHSKGGLSGDPGYGKLLEMLRKLNVRVDFQPEVAIAQLPGYRAIIRMISEVEGMTS